MTDNYDVEKRLRYFNGQFLNNYDFTDEQKYHIDRQRRHNRLLHTPGIAEGLEIIAECNSHHIEVRPGTAVDQQGRQIVLATKQVKSLRDFGCGKVYVVISYHQEPSDLATVGARDETRWHEHPKIEILEDSDEIEKGDRIPLACLVLGDGGKIEHHHDHVRYHAGVRISPEVDLRKLTFSSKSVHCSCWPELHFGAAHRIDLIGSLYIERHLGIGVDNPKNRLDVKGGAVIGADYCERQQAPTDGLLVKGRVGIGNNSPGSSLEIAGETRNDNYSALNVTDCDGKSLLFVRNDGNIGVGTTQPRAKFHVSGGNIRLDPDSELFFADNGQIRSLDDNHRILFNRSQDQMEFRERGDLIFSPGAIDGTQTAKAVILGNGNVGIGIKEPNVKLHVEGEIRGNLVTGTGSDYAECLPKLQQDEVIEEGDITGIFAGKITKKTNGAQTLMVISSRPMVIGNTPTQDKKHLYEKVAFMGQVRVKVRGKVQAGDYIIPSGLNDGVGVATSTQEINPTAYAQIVGSAWESSQEEGVKLINVLVGLQSSYSWVGQLMAAMQNQQTEIESLKSEIASLHSQIETTAAQPKHIEEIESLQSEIASIQSEIISLKSIREQITPNHQTEIESLKHEINSVKTELEQITPNHQTEIESLKHEINSVKTELEQITPNHQTEIESLKHEINSVKTELAKTNIPNYQAELKIINLEMEYIKTQIRQLSKTNGDTNVTNWWRLR